MKRILILTILLMSSLAWAGSTTVVVGQGGGGGCTWGSGDSALIDGSGFTDQEWDSATGTTQGCQTYTIPTSGTIITGAKIKIGDSNAAGSLVVELMNQDGSGHAGTSVLATATIGNASIPSTGGTLTFVDVQFSSPYTTIETNQLVALRLRAIDGGYFTIRYQSSGDAYASGQLSYSTNAGSTWNARSGADMLGSIWGCTP